MKKQEFLLYKGQEIEKIDIAEGEKIVVHYKHQEPDLPKSWEELGKIEGWYLGSYSNLESVPFHDKCEEHLKNTFPTKEEAEASIALAQLCQLRDRWNEEWKVDWSDDKQERYCVLLYGIPSRVLVFKSQGLRHGFLENFHDLIEKAKPLL